MCGFLAYLHVKVVESAAVFGCCARISRLSDNFHLFFCCRPNVNCRLLKFFAQAKQMINYATVRLCVSVRLSASFGPGMRFLHISSKRFFIFNFFTPPCQEGKCNFVIYFHCQLLPVIIYGPSNIANLMHIRMSMLDHYGCIMSIYYGIVRVLINIYTYIYSWIEG